MIRKAITLAFLILGFLNPDAFGFSSDISSLTRSFNKTTALTNSVIGVTVIFTNSGTTALRGFCYTDQIPSGLTVTTLGVTLNALIITNYTFETGQDGDVHAGCTPCRWRLESPTNYAEANPIPPQAQVQIIYSIHSPLPGVFPLQQFSWAGYNTVGTNAVFGFSESTDQRTVSIVPGTFDAPRFQSISKSSTGSITLTCHVQPGRTYQLQFKNSLSETNWMTLGGNYTPTSSSLVITNNPGTGLSRFYRILDTTAT